MAPLFETLHRRGLMRTQVDVSLVDRFEVMQLGLMALWIGSGLTLQKFSTSLFD